MSDIKSQHEIDEMRKRLYSRGFEGSHTEHHLTHENTVEVAKDWGAAAATVPSAPTPAVAAPVVPEVKEKHPHHYRKFVLIGSLIVLVLGAAAAGALWYLGSNNISGENINLTISGPSTIGGSETMSFQVGVSNQNTVAVDSAVLVVKYPKGARSVGDPAKNLYEERTTIGSLAPGEAKNVPIQAGIYGKENESQQIEATLEYRITGSDGTFYKVAEPLRFQIISSPLIMQISSIRKVSAGQDVEVTVTVKSNTSKTQKDVIVSAQFPNGFSYKSSDPEPIYNQNTWKIDELGPEQSAKIKIKGTISGLTSEVFGINFAAGVAETNNQFIVGSLLAEARTEFMVESPFIDVGISIGGDADGSAIIEEGKGVPVSINISNTLDETVYDMVVEVVPSGNALDASSVSGGSGFYDSNRGTIRWEVSNNPDFAQIFPNTSRRLDFSLSGDSKSGPASFDVTVNVYAKRVAETSAQEQLIGTVKANAKYASKAGVSSQVNYMSGPIPPVVGQTTTYLVALVAEAGTNDMTNTTVRTTLPTYINWLNDFSGSGSVEYNPVSKEVIWNAGDVKGKTKKELIFSVSILPSTSQVGITPVLLNDVNLRAVDRFTNTPLTAVNSFRYLELPPETGYEEGNGIITQ
ncbi:MAG: hypothetical protein RLZZ480_262 [Candidatus Parcubacteria bacterium]|jgi:hypothetical protein